MDIVKIIPLYIKNNQSDIGETYVYLGLFERRDIGKIRSNRK